MPSEPLPTLLTPEEVAGRFRVKPNTVRGWVRAGRIVAIRTPGRHYRFTEQAIQDAQDQMEIDEHGSGHAGGATPAGTPEGAPPATPDHEHPSGLIGATGCYHCYFGP